MADNRPRSEEDTEAIMNRRRFLIKSTLAGAVLSTSLAGCKSDAEPGPEPCLSVVDPDAAKPKPKLEAGSQPATVPPTPKICLSRVPDQPKIPVPAPPPPQLLRPCLSIRRPPRSGQTP